MEPGSDDGEPAGIDEGGPAGMDDGAALGGEDGGPAGADAGGPAGMDDGAPLGSEDGGPAWVDAGGPAGTDAGGPAGVDAGGPAGVDAGGPAGMDDGAPLLPAWLLPSEAIDEMALALSIPVVDGSVARPEITWPLVATVLLVVELAVVLVVVVASSSPPERPRVPGWSPPRLSEPGTLIPTLASTEAAVSWAAPGRVPVAAAAPVADATVSAPAARSVLALSNRRDRADLLVAPVRARTVRNIATASD
jgi:hypothetical protein